MAERSIAAVLPHRGPYGENCNPMFYTYILKSTKDHKYYYGYCEDIQTCLKSHNMGKVRSTKSRRPFLLHYSEHFQTKTEAIRRELFFKSIDGYNWLKQKGII
jgi:putative endonuclease